jgi:hypothetical protein
MVIQSRINTLKQFPTDISNQTDKADDELQRQVRPRPEESAIDLTSEIDEGQLATFTRRANAAASLRMNEALTALGYDEPSSSQSGNFIISVKWKPTLNADGLPERITDTGFYHGELKNVPRDPVVVQKIVIALQESDKYRDVEFALADPTHGIGPTTIVVYNDQENVTKIFNEIADPVFRQQRFEAAQREMEKRMQTMDTESLADSEEGSVETDYDEYEEYEDGEEDEEEDAMEEESGGAQQERTSRWLDDESDEEDQEMKEGRSSRWLTDEESEEESDEDNDVRLPGRSTVSHSGMHVFALVYDVGPIRPPTDDSGAPIKPLALAPLPANTD